MRLLELELENFKSFRGRRAIPFGSGFTCITGPNGAGKSNLTDAILFMLMPRSAKPLRAHNLRELIFNGGKRGRPAKECSVSMTFDNQDRELAVEADRVVLTRGVRRRGDQNQIFYQLNDRRSTAREFEVLLSRAGLFAEGYNIIQQGHVSETSMMSPADRRKRLEDVAGITAFEKSLRRTRAQRRSVEESLDILAERRKETRRRLAQLEREKADAERLANILVELKETDRLLLFREVLDLEAERARRTTLADTYRQEIERLTERLAELARQAETAAADITTAEAEIAAAGGDEARELQRQLDLARVAEAVARQAAEHAGRRLAELETERLELHETHRTAAREHQQLAAEHAAAAAEEARQRETIAESESQLATLERQAADSSREAAQQREAVEALRGREGELATRRSRLEGELEGLTRQLEAAAEEAARAEENLAAARSDVEEADWARDELAVGRKSAAANLRKLKRKATDALADANEMAAEVRELEASVRAATVQHASLVAAQKAHEEIYHSYGRAEQALLAARDAGELRGLVGTVAELGQVDERYETALQVTAGRRLQSLVTEDDNAAARAIDHLKSQRLGRARFLPLNRLRPYRPGAAAILISRQPGAVGFAIDLVAHDPRYRDAFGNVFGDTLIMESLPLARPHLGKCRMVTLDGELLERGGAMVGGTRPRGGPAFGAVDRNELDRAAALLRDLETQLERAMGERDRLAQQADELAQAHRELESEYSTSQTRLSDYDGRVDETRTRLSAAEQRVAARSQVCEELAAELAQRENEQQTLAAEADGLAAELAQATTLLEAAVGGATADAHRRLTRDLAAARGELARWQSRGAGLAATLEERAREVARLAETLAANEAEQRTQQETRVAEAGRAEGLAREVKALRQREQQEFHKLEGLRQRRDALHDRLAELRATHERERERRRERRNGLDDLELEVADLTTHLVQARERLPAGDAPAEVPPLGRLESRRETLARQRDRLGNVNMLSLDHYRAEEERLGELQDHIKQLRGEVRRLVGLEEKISHRRESRFMVVFKAVDANLRDIFPELTGGGEAWLELDNPDAPLDGGVRLMARMPRKRLYSVEALSGGEKSMVSMAFIFALQRHNPSPFYLLDEIDMNLDGVNTEHIGRTIALQSAVAQFIVVTLHHATLRECNHVLGVFMDENGLSNIRRIPDVDEFLAALPVEAAA